jgi:hypothetical protein
MGDGVLKSTIHNTIAVLYSVHPTALWADNSSWQAPQRGSNKPRKPRQQGTKGGKKAQAQAPSACARFAKELADRLYNAVVLEGGYNPESRHDFANEMSRRGENNVDFYGNYFDKKRYPIDGFKPALTANNQLADVYRHILFAGGDSLHGTAGGDLENLVFRLYDWQQSVRGRSESDTELADDYAGMEVGDLMYKTAMAGKSGNYEQLMKDIKYILCAF